MACIGVRVERTVRPVTDALVILSANHDCSVDTIELATFAVRPRTSDNEQLSLGKTALSCDEAKCSLAQLMNY